MFNFRKASKFYFAGAIILIIVIAIGIYYVKRINVYKRPISFNKENFHVQFTPHLSLEWPQKYYSENELVPFINKVRDRFRKLFSLVSCDYYDEIGLNNLASSAALYNRNVSATETEEVAVVLLVELDLLSNCSFKTSFEVATKIAEKANTIHNGTVDYLIIVYDKAKFGEVREAKKYLSNTVGVKRYKLGIKVRLADCIRENILHPDIFLLLPIIDTIVFDVTYPTQEDYTSGPANTIGKYYENFTLCEREIRRKSHSVEVGFAASWSSIDPDGVLNFRKQVEFWAEMNTWSIKNNTQIFLERAFDNVINYTSHDTRFGWWKLLPDKSSTDIGYQFVDKEELARQQEQADEPNTLIDLAFYIGIPVGTFLILICFYNLMCYVYRRRRQLLTNKELQAYWEKFQSSEIKFTEFAHDSFQVFENLCLGSGEFGLVCQGTVTKDSEIIKVAAKMTKQPCTAIVLKSLLSELTIIASIGIHDNIIGLIGACTEGIRKNELFIFTELCENGTLESYFQNNNKMDGNMRRNLFRWSYEISCGMEHVASKNIVHMDIATRNVLLSSNLTAKISDFGLSRRLYNYQMYTKKNEEPLPWRWMAPEALQKLQFTEKSDVWSFGVTLWEIFSLGSLPYAGILWDPNFFRVLEAGLRLQKPNFNPQNIFNDVIRPCWELSTDERPTFYQLKSMLQMICDTKAEFEGLQSNDIGIVRGWVDCEEPGQSFVGYTSFANLS